MLRTKKSDLVDGIQTQTGLVFKHFTIDQATHCH
jgi:hypothetical protein